MHTEKPEKPGTTGREKENENTLFPLAESVFARKTGMLTGCALNSIFYTLRSKEKARCGEKSLIQSLTLAKAMQYAHEFGLM